MHQNNEKNNILDRVIRAANELKSTDNPVTKSTLQGILLNNALAYINDGFPEHLHVTVLDRKSRN